MHYGFIYYIAATNSKFTKNYFKIITALALPLFLASCGAMGDKHPL